jgi:hypothetical protein
LRARQVHSVKYTKAGMHQAAQLLFLKMEKFIKDVLRPEAQLL